MVRDVLSNCDKSDVEDKSLVYRKQEVMSLFVHISF